MKRICHITTVHPRYDVRIFHKECKSLSKHYKVYLIVADGLGDEVKEEINIIDIGLRQSSRLKRARVDSAKALKKAKELDCDLYHFHDPELIFIGKKLIKKGKKVIYDVHEDVPRQILSKPYLKSYLKPIISKIFEKYENRNAKCFSYIITATDFIKDRFLIINKKSESVKNYPIVEELKTDINWEAKKNKACYVGAIDKTRGIVEIVEALNYSDYSIDLAGKFSSEKLKQEIQSKKSWDNVKFYGFADRDLVKQILEESKVGLVTLHPTISYIDALPVKMFEYMLAGIPVISTNIPLWEQIIKDSFCGISVDPFNPKEIADAINKIIEDDKLAEQMGRNGRKAIIEKFNWANEEEILIDVYKSIFS